MRGWQDRKLLRRFIAAALETTRFPAVALDGAGRIIAVNKALAGKAGLPATDCVRRPFWDVFYEGMVLDGEGKFLSPLVETLATGREFTNRYHPRPFSPSKRTQDQSGRFISTFISSNHDGSTGTVWSFFFPAGSARDIYMEKVFTVRSIVELIASRDAYTRGHMERVTAYALTMGHMLSLRRADLVRLFVGAITHDVGKFFVPQPVLQKPGRLTVREMQIMRWHPVHGADILASLAVSPEIVNIVRHHHERYDGTGYPEGLRGEDIPRLSRIIAVADAFEAMTADRIYRPALPVHDALAELEKNAGSQFDPRVVRAMLDFAGAMDIAKCKNYVRCLGEPPCPGCLDRPNFR